MPKVTILSRVDAYIDYTTEVEADSLEEAVDLAYEGDPSIKWKEQGVVEFDARHVAALDADGEEIESYSPARARSRQQVQLHPTSRVRDLFESHYMVRLRPGLS